MRGFADFERYDGLGLAELVRRHEVKPAEILEAAIGRIEERNTAVNAVVTRLYDQARETIVAGLPSGPFTGVPYLLKDLGVLYAGAPTSFGSAFFAGVVADHDSEITARLKRAGFVILGKSNTPELGLAPSTEPRLFGPTRNPWNLAYSAGGSSGGAAAAVAAGMLPMAHATDGGGSIRIPASCCGLFGLKPTRARNPMGPDAGEGWGGASSGMPSRGRCATALRCSTPTSGPDVGDPYWAPPPTGPFLAEVGRDPGRLRIALTTTPWNGQPSIPNVPRRPGRRPSCARHSAITWRKRGPRSIPMPCGWRFASSLGPMCALSSTRGPPLGDAPPKPRTSRR